MRAVHVQLTKRTHLTIFEWWFYYRLKHAKSDNAECNGLLLTIDFETSKPQNTHTTISLFAFDCILLLSKQDFLFLWQNILIFCYKCNTHTHGGGEKINMQKVAGVSGWMFRSNSIKWEIDSNADKCVFNPMDRNMINWFVSGIKIKHIVKAKMPSTNKIWNE